MDQCTASLPFLPSEDVVWGWHQELAAMGPRFTGSPGHESFIEWLKVKFGAVYGFQLQPPDSIPFQRWLAKDWSLRIDQDPMVGPSGPVPVSYYYPYSGMTNGGGVKAKLVDLGIFAEGLSTPSFWAPANGAIALVRLPPFIQSMTFDQVPIGGFEPGRDQLSAVLDYVVHTGVVKNPVFSLRGIPLLDARNAGVRGVVVVWSGMSDAMVANQYTPFAAKYPNASGVPVPGDYGCPALWVGDSTGQGLAHSAAAGTATVTLTLTADITKDAVTETVWGVLRGTGGDGRSLIINSHTDGPNVPEENGALGMLALAQHFAQQGHSRDLYFVMATGHFQILQFDVPIPNPRFVIGNDAISRWMVAHPAIYQQALAGVTLEHLGCTMWGDDDEGSYVCTGPSEWGTTYTTQKQGPINLNNLELRAYLEAVEATNNCGIPTGPVGMVLPSPIFFGEGAPLYAGGLGTVSTCALPSYLLQVGSLTEPHLLNLDKLDKQLIHGQIQSFCRTISTLDAAAAGDF
jgi:hypothetical protein